MKEPEDDEVALKLLHTADWHLGRKFGDFDEADALKLTRARLDVIRRVLDLGRQHAVDAVLCAGDLFDQEVPDSLWWEGLVRCLADRPSPHCPVILLPGNHDPLVRTSVYYEGHPFRRALPADVHVVDRDDFSLPIGDEAVVYATPCRSRAGASDPAMSLPERAPGDDRIRIGLAHGQTFDMKKCTVDFPIDPAATKKRGLDYLAIGDTHSFREIAIDGAGPTVYPGAPEATTFDEPDAGHVALVFFARKGRRALVRRQRVAQWTWRQETVRDPTALRTLADTQDLKQTVLRLTVEMSVSLEEMSEVERILLELKGTEAALGRAGIMQCKRDGLRLDMTGVDSSFVDVPDVLRATVARLKQREAAGEGELARRALYHLYRVVQGGASRT